MKKSLSRVFSFMAFGNCLNSTFKKKRLTSFSFHDMNHSEGDESSRLCREKYSQVSVVCLQDVAATCFKSSLVLLVLSDL